MLRETERRTHDGVVLHRSVLIVGSLEACNHGIVRSFWMQGILDWTLERLVVFRERTISKSPQRRENSPDAFRIHDEWAHVILWLGIGLEIRHVVSDPFLLVFVPPNLLSRCVPGLTVHVARCAVVQHAAIRRPRPAPTRMHAHVGGIGGITPRSLISRFREGSRINPVATGRRAVILQPGEAWKLLARLDLHLGRGIFQIGQGLPIKFLQYFCQRRAVWSGVAPSEFQNWIGELAAIFFVKVSDPEENLRDDSLS